MSEDRYGYDKSQYTYEGDNLINEKGESVMMGWERPVMKKVCDIITHNRGDVLNIGFGMGIIDTMIQKRKVRSHTIIESHPDVQEKIKSDGWLEKDKTNIIFGKWQNEIKDLPRFDGIYLDTWYDERVMNIKPLLENCLKDNGVFSMWYNHNEFERVKNVLGDSYNYEYRYIENENLIPEDQYKEGGYYINPKRKYIVIPIVTKKIK